jgi:peptidoglycan/LPS O-acetylase OafA/YrhL
MGTLRFLLAIAVLLYHMSGVALFDMPAYELMMVRPLSGNSAVETFFIISGFAMAGALSTRYRDRPVGRFYASRVLRLYPAYLLILAVHIVAAALLWRPGLPQPVNLFMADAAQPPAERLVWTISSFLVVGKELWFQGNDFAKQFVNPAWSLSIELQFYLLIPFLVRWPIRRLIVLFGLALAYRVLLFVDLGHVPPIYYSLPWHLCLFLAGVLSYRLFEHWQSVSVGVAIGPAAAVMLLTVLFPHYTEGDTRADWLKIGYWLALFFTLPLLSRLSEGSRIDGFLGDLSYPIYLANLGVIYTMVSVGPIPAPLAVFATVGATVMIAVLVVLGIDRPMTLIRRELAARHRPLLATA